MDLWKDAWRSIFRRPSRSGLTILSIAIGIFAVMMIGTIGEMGKEAIAGELESLGMQGIAIRAGDGSGVSLTRAELELVRDSPDVAEATPLSFEYDGISAQGNAEKAVLWGIDSDASAVFSMELRYGRGIEPGDVAAAAEVCVVEEGLARQIFGRENAVGRQLEVSIGGFPHTLEVIGVASVGGSLFQSMMGSTVPLFVYLPYTTHQLYSGRQGFDRIAVRLRGGSGAAGAGAALSAELDGWYGQNGAVTVDNLSQYAGTLENLLDMVTAILSVIAGISLVVAGLSVMTAMLSSVGERTREIGIKKSMGAPSGTIVAEFLLEASFLSIVGSAAGITAGIAVCWAGSLLLGAEYRLQPELIAVCLLSALAIGAVFGAYPAHKASLLRPVEALR